MARRERPEVRGVGRAGEVNSVEWKPSKPPKEVLVDDDGYLHCETCGALNATWCQHIAEWITSGQDGLWQLWGIPYVGSDDRIIAVPLFPNSGNVFWATVMLEATDRKYVWNASLNLFPAGATESERYYLGVLGPGDGRNAARNMVFNFLMSAQLSICKQRTHKYQQVRAVDKLEPGSVDYLQNRWLEITQSCCVYCWPYVAESRGWSEWTPAQLKEK
jgi:hypothetical protein